MSILAAPGISFRILPTSVLTTTIKSTVAGLPDPPCSLIGCSMLMMVANCISSGADGAYSISALLVLVPLVQLEKPLHHAHSDVQLSRKIVVPL